MPLEKITKLKTLIEKITKLKTFHKEQALAPTERAEI